MTYQQNLSTETELLLLKNYLKKIIFTIIVETIVCNLCYNVRS